MQKKLFLILIIVFSISSLYLYSQPEFRWELGKSLQMKEGTSPQTIDSNLKIDQVVIGAEHLTTFAFIDDDILYLEKTTGDVKLIKNSKVQKEPVYHFDVYKVVEAGLLGITINDDYVYIYVSEPLDEQGKIPNENNI